MLRRLLLALAAAAAALAVAAVPVVASPELAIKMTHANAYGQQVSECPTAKEEYFPSETERDCGVDPFTGSGTTFDRGSGNNQYTITIENMGSSPTSGTVTVADELPRGLALAPPRGVETRISATGWQCSAPTTTAFACTRSDALAPAVRYPPLSAFVHVNSEVATTLVNEATVAGGGAGNTHTAYDPTTIASVPFGVDVFTTSVTTATGEPFTQASGHPFAANTTFVLNSVPGDQSTNGGASTMTAGEATVKSAEVELPSGFLGDPQNAERCRTTQELLACPAGSIVGFVAVSAGPSIVAGRLEPPFNIATHSPLWSLEPQPGRAAEFGFIFAGGVPLILEAQVRSDGDYGVTVGDEYAGKNGPAPVGVSVTLCADGVTGSLINGQLENGACAPTPQSGITGPFLTTPSQCTGRAPSTTLVVNSWEHPSTYKSKAVYNGTKLVNGEPSPTESFVTGCNLLQFTPGIELDPTAGAEGTTELDSPTGAQFNLKVPAINATPALKHATVTLPEGMTANPAAASGLEACSDAQFGLGSTTEPAEPAHCPLASQVGTVEVCTPLLANQSGEAHSGEEVDQQCEEDKAVSQLQGQAFIGAPECSPCSSTDTEEGKLFRLFLEIQAPERGIVVKLAGRVSANPLTGRLQATFAEQPQLSFGELRLKLKGGPRAPLATPQACGPASTTAVLTPWSAPGLGGITGSEPIAGTPNAEPTSTFNVDWNGAGGACPSTLPFSPTFAAGTESSVAGTSSPLSVTFRRQDREQDLSGVTVNTPSGLLGRVSEISQCGEPEANANTCPSTSQIGTATVAAGAGTDPYWLTGNVYLTGPYAGDPYGLSVAVPAKAGPFKLAGNAGNGTEVVRAGIAVNPSSAALTITSDPLPQVVDGVPLRLRTVHVEVNRPGFMLNPTSCTQLSIGATITGAGGATVNTASPFGPTGCAALPFRPTITATASQQTSLRDGAGLNVTVTAVPGEANLGKVDLTLPKVLPSRISTLQQACIEAQFAANPAGCPDGSNIGTAIAHTPLLTNPLIGPIYLVSHGNAAFPDIEFVLQGENGLTIVLDGKTQISHGTTYSRFESLPDAPISSFDTTLPEGPHSILSASKNLCTAKNLTLGVTAIGQNGAQEMESVPIDVNGCKASTPPPLTRARKLAAALTSCRNHDKHARTKRLACESLARRRYAVKASKSRRTK
jgi:hypothetical protein